jgi:hypothetical protein
MDEDQPVRTDWCRLPNRDSRWSNRLQLVATSTTLTGTRSGVLRLKYGARSGASVPELSSTLAALGLLVAASSVIAMEASQQERNPRRIFEPQTILRFIMVSQHLPTIMDDTPSGDDVSPLAAALRLGASSFFIDPIEWFGVWPDAVGMEELAEEIWKRYLPDATRTARIVHISMSSPLEIVLVAPLATAAAVNSFVILVEAIRRLYRGAQGLRLDAALIETQLAECRADLAENALREAISRDRLLHTRATDKLRDTVPRNEQLELMEADATIEKT